MIVAMAIGLALLIQAFVVKPYQIPSGSMEPTLDPGQRVLVNRVIYHLKDPDIGDVVVFHPPVGADERAVRGAPGVGRAVSRSPRPEHRRPTSSSGSWRGPATGCRFATGIRWSTVRRRTRTSSDRAEAGTSATSLTQITIPEDMYFMMGDNRGASDDSRFWGPVPRSWIIGQAFFTYWPPDRIGIL